ncbi:hypothetical protein C8J56DRAFT_1066824 [Mycena floridula]|nr:hypothetical protein C8J56DRAFT_1066824 [Mycena floridula]
MAPNLKSSQLRAARLGVASVSPIKKRNAKKTGTLVNTAGQSLRRMEIRARLQQLKPRTPSPEPIVVDADSDDSDTDSDDIAMVDDPNDQDYGTPTPQMLESEPPVVSTTPDISFDSAENRNEPNERPSTTQKKPRSTEPGVTMEKLYNNWKKLMPALLDPYLVFQNDFTARPMPGPASLFSVCRAACSQQICQVKCYFLDSVYSINVSHCRCQGPCLVLVQNGLFPASPSAPRTAFSIPLLDFYNSLFEQSCDAVNAMSSALQGYYEHRGYPFLHQNGSLVMDGIRHPLSATVQWYDCLKVMVSKRVDQAVQICAQAIDDFNSASRAVPVASSAPDSPLERGSGGPAASNSDAASSSGRSDAPAPESASPSREPELPLAPGEAARILQDRCPACFGGRLWGRSFRRGGDFHVSTDGNFHHSRFRNAGSTPPFYDPSYFLSPEYVQEIKAKVDAARSKPQKQKPKKLPDDAVDACEESHEAAKGEHKKGRQQFDDHGIMSLVCRHDVPLFFVNIDTPGEGQHYPVALITHLFSLLPREATGLCLYDLACVMDQSSELYDLFSLDVIDRLQFATTAMHAYAHQWSCLTDGEGVERIWSAIRALIGIARHSSRTRRIWLLDRLLKSTASRHRDTLGEWLRNKLIKLGKLENKHQDALRSCVDTEAELRHQWALQKAEQTSIRAHLPARLKKELEQVLTLQTEIDTINASIQAVRATLIKTPGAVVPLANLHTLETAHVILKGKADDLYASLNVAETYPELQGIQVAFVLLLARDLKISLHKRAIGSFLEMDRLDQAVGGGNEALGTKVHQITRKSMKKRSPALLAAVVKFNEYVDTLRSMHQPRQRIPIPKALPTTLQELRESPDLHEDVWISKTPQGEIPRWLEDLDLRNGIHAQLYLDRCLEERRRLGQEADNMCRWFGRTFAVLQLAISCKQYSGLLPELKRRWDHLLSLRLLWQSPLVSEMHYNTRISAALALVQRLTASEMRLDLLRIPPAPAISPAIDDADSEDANSEDDETIVVALDPAFRLADIMEALEVDSDDDEEVEVMQAPLVTVDDMHTVVHPRLFRPTPMPFKRIPLSHDNLIRLSSKDMRCAFSQFTNSFFPDRDRPGTERRFDTDRVKGLAGSSLSYNSLQRVRQPQRWLDDDSIRVAANLLFSHCVRLGVKPRFALFSSSLPVQVSLEAVWRQSKPSMYWDERPIWLLPYHRVFAKHWVLYIVYLNTGTIHLFDSFGEHRPSDNETASIVDLVQSLIDLANQNGHPLMVPVEEWIVSPIVSPSAPLQHNGYDCGVWILAQIFAVLSGVERVGGLEEKDINDVRRYILSGILSLPAFPESSR